MEFIKITSFQNNSVKHAVKLRERRDREKEQLTLLEGYRELTRGQEYGMEITECFFAPEQFLGENEYPLLESLANNGVKVMQVTPQILTKLAYRDRPEGSESKLNTYSDGIKVLLTIAKLFRVYKPLAFFGIIALILLGALLVNKIAGHRSRKSFFIMELPEYKLPSLKRATLSMISRGWSYIVKAGTIILLCNFIVHVMQTFNWSFQVVEEGMENTSILATIANPFAYILIPVVGYHAWQLAAAAVTGFIAKENVVGTLAVCYGISNLIDTEALEMASGAGSEVAAVFGMTKAAALAYLMFNLFTPPCFAAIGAMNSEIRDRKWLFGGIALQLSTGFVVGFLVYQIGTLITEGHLGAGFVPGLIAVAVIAVVIGYLCIKGDEKRAKKGKK